MDISLSVQKLITMKKDISLKKTTIEKEAEKLNISSKKLEEMWNFFIQSIVNRIASGSISLTKCAAELKIDRGTLRKYLEERLSEEEQLKLKEIMEKSKKREKKSSRTQIREKKKVSEEQQYTVGISLLGKYGVTEQEIKEVFHTMPREKNTTITEATFTMKVVELLTYFQDRNEKEHIEKGSNGYIGKEEIFQQLLRNHKFMTNDIRNKVVAMCELLDSYGLFTPEQINEFILRYPYIFNYSLERIDTNTMIMNNITITKPEGVAVNLWEYVMEEQPSALIVNSQKLYARLREEGTVLNMVQVGQVLKNDNRSITLREQDEELMSKFPLPEYEKEKREEFAKKVAISFGKDLKGIFPKERKNPKEGREE